MSRRSRWLWLMAGLTAFPAVAGEMHVDAPVVDVLPITTGPARGGSDHRTCAALRPGPGATLTDLLAWDLRIGCVAGDSMAAEPLVTGYRVYYRWDDRTFTRVVSEPPGDTIPLRVRID